MKGEIEIKGAKIPPGKREMTRINSEKRFLKAK